MVHNELEGARLIESNLFAAIPDDQLFDVIVFNPPYVETEAEEL